MILILVSGLQHVLILATGIASMFNVALEKYLFHFLLGTKSLSAMLNIDMEISRMMAGSNHPQGDLSKVSFFLFHSAHYFYFKYRAY